ncbi:MAG: hypothetical protein M1327_03445 [Candidatus Thermoplasmatota archaeon]|nr:hypothetical protein [Candidatus Thermoplasmatota archaeon]
MDYADSWNTLVGLALISGAIRISKKYVSNIGDPVESGLFLRSIGMQRGQKADFRASIEGSSLAVHLVEFTAEYELHIDRFDPSKNLLSHIVFDYLPSMRGRRIMRQR